ncbi:DUF1624 domain-containing protein [Geojedonia litorea]|uniref:DUF1624 domain-containing protein n=1 Tax=Geojedonia litorea TaxID=1268269 RepID=A0ABV9MZX9_9FLAO
MNLVKSSRIQSIDLLRGLVMVIMALDHVRDYFHLGAFHYDPVNMDTTTPMLFFTRFITHYCAPIFVFLAGTSAFLYGSRKTKSELFKFLVTRGLWLIVVEIVIMNFLWWFDVSYGFINLQVIWAIGICMILLGFLILLPLKVILIFGLIMVFGHNALDGIVMQGSDFKSVLWYALHQQNFVPMGSRMVGLFYPIIPWVGVMGLGYCFGKLYQSGFDASLRKKWLLWLGLGSIILFFVLRGINSYGDMIPWSQQKNTTFTIMSFFNVYKYPPSLLFLLITIGPGFLFLFFTESVKNKVTEFLLVFGRVPFFYYVLHVFLIHALAMGTHALLGGNWRDLILDANIFTTNTFATYGYSLFVVYLVWIGVVLLLYPVCKKYMTYKINNKDKWWLSYL